jgi:hypothetical protein
LLLRGQRARPIANELHGWLQHKRLQVRAGSATAKAIDYSLRRWQALTHYRTDGNVPIDNHWIENPIRPIALGRKMGCSREACGPANAQRQS